MLAAAALIVSGVALVGAPVLAASDSQPLSVEAEYVDTPEPAILFHVRTTEPYRMYEADLPWGNVYSVQLTFRRNSGKPVCALLIQPIDDPSSTDVRLVPGQAASGKVLLASRCPALAKLRSRDPVAVEWTYTGVIRRIEGSRFKGRLIVPAKRDVRMPREP